MGDFSRFASKFSRIAEELPSSRGSQATSLRAALRSWSAEAGRAILDAAPPPSFRRSVPRTWFDIARAQDALTKLRDQAAEALGVPGDDAYPAAIQDAYTSDWQRALSRRLRVLSGDGVDVIRSTMILNRIAASGKAARTRRSSSSEWKQFVEKFDEEVRLLLREKEITPRSECHSDVARYLRAVANQPRFDAYHHPVVIEVRCSPPVDVFELSFGMAHAQQLRERDAGVDSGEISVRSFVDRHVFLEYVRSSKRGARSSILQMLGLWTMRAAAQVTIDVASDYLNEPQDLTELAILYATYSEAKIEAHLAARVTTDGAEDTRPSNSMTTAPDGRAAAVATSPATHSDDYSTVNWYGTRYVFNRRQQAQVVALLWGSEELPFPAIRVGTIRKHLGSAADVFRLGEIFRDSSKGTKHPAWGTMIQQIGKGLYQLIAPVGDEIVDPMPSDASVRSRDGKRREKRR
jgi:hypothetical protein